ncbi:MATE family efflux transporter [Roseixanthobacter glucoisosaccharinicivorans]|uniref:hypothetical protein n=1 Tax=Roseixanthobacter glucoisosaccharinicivorans TaxID=3119923 RepID=UPI00372A6DED
MLAARFPAAKRFFVSFILPLVIINFGNATAYLFQFLLVHALTLDDFGRFSALFSAMNVLWTPAVIIPLIACQLAIELKGLGKSAEARLFFRATLVVGGVSSVIFLLVAAGSAPLAALFHVSFPAIIGAGACVTLLFVQPIGAGLLQARGNYVSFAVAQGAVSTFRVVFGIIFVWFAGWGVSGAVWSCALPVILSLAFVVWKLRDLIGIPTVPLPSDTSARLVRVTYPQAVTATCIALLSYADIVIVGMQANPSWTGLYSAAAILSRVVLLLPSALAGIIFSEAAQSRARGELGRGNFNMTFGLTAAISVGSGLLLLFSAEFILTRFFGKDFALAVGISHLTTGAMVMLATAQASMMFLAGRKNYHYLLPLCLFSGGFIFYATLYATDPWGVAAALFFTNTCVAIVVFGLTFVPANGFRRRQVI